jgi:hypothetical protein
VVAEQGWAGWVVAEQPEQAEQASSGPGFMIMGSFGRYSVETTHDHELCWVGNELLT